ncbi:hypothetical protein K438DRAFT_878746 [Mycena galopus ATCC 62051]|nr:hypothetical protein K438DRAFT_878746 [Mycena galopus ATCC 62051]
MGGTGGSGVYGRGGDGGVGEGPTVNYHMNAGASVHHIQRQSESGFYILHRASADAAVHDSAENYCQPKCHPETRAEMLEDLWKWSLDSDPNCRVLWLYGPAGAGKSSVARSFCQKLAEGGRLGASFFFQRGHPSRGDGHKLFPTIAYQLCRAAPVFKDIVCRRVEDDPAITNRSLSVQLEQLIIKPCWQSNLNPGLVLVIDGLDECAGRNIQEAILRSFSMHREPLPFLVFIASRPEVHLREIFISALQGIYLSVNLEQSFEDVWKYLKDEFARIRRDHHETMATVPLPWPTREITDNLVQKSSGYFIYASTVIRFIDDKDFRPTERLQVITGIREPRPESGSPFAALDALYIQILCAVPHDHRPLIPKILAVVAAKLRLSIGNTDELLELEPGEVRLVLRGLRSVIGAKMWDRFECNDWSPESYIVFHHASFHDLLQDPARAGIFYIGSSSLQTDLCRHILKALSCSNRRRFVGWCRNRELYQYIASSTPSSDLITLLRSLNPDLLFGTVDADTKINIVLSWLKQSQPLPEDLIHLWEDYRFMERCEAIWLKQGHHSINHQLEDQEHSFRILSQATPSLLPILRAIASRVFLMKYMARYLLTGTRLLLNLSWDELRTAICSLCPLIPTSDMEKIVKNVFRIAWNPAFSPPPCDTILRNCTCGALCLMRQIIQGEVDKSFQQYILGWSFYLRSCPPSYKLLEELRDIEPFSNDAYNIMQWLKTFPRPPRELINSFQGFRDQRDPFGFKFQPPDIIERDWEAWCRKVHF